MFCSVYKNNTIHFKVWKKNVPFFKFVCNEQAWRFAVRTNVNILINWALFKSPYLFYCLFCVICFAHSSKKTGKVQNVLFLFFFIKIMQGRIRSSFSNFELKR